MGIRKISKERLQKIQRLEARIFRLKQIIKKINKKKRSDLK